MSHYAVIPVRIKVKDRIYTAALSLDTMTHNDYRGKEIFPILAARLYDELGKSGISLTFGFPNEYSVNGFIKKLA